MKLHPRASRYSRSTRYSLYSLLLLICALITLLVYLGVAGGNPSLGDCTCHTSDGYSISANVTSKMQVSPSGSFNVLIKATGMGGIVQFHPDARDNRLFIVAPNDTIVDNSILDLDPTPGNVTVAFTITAPASEETYTINFFVRSPTGPKPSIACVEIDVQVGAGNLFLDIVESIFDHYNIYLGAGALAFLITGTIIYEKDKHAVKAHGILCTISLGLTTVNIIAIFPAFLAMIPYWTAFSFIDWMHIVHVVVGFVGYGAAIVAMIAGLGGIRDRRFGYAALACWVFCFVLGVVFWGFGL